MGLSLLFYMSGENACNSDKMSKFALYYRTTDKNIVSGNELYKKNRYTVFLSCCFALCKASGPGRLPCFTTSPYFGEQVLRFVYSPGIRIQINAPSASDFDKDKPTKVVLYALPNGNSTEWTIGKLPAKDDDWHFHIQHIGAQTRYVRTVDRSCNIVAVYLEADTKSWGSWRKADSGRDEKIKEVVEYLLEMFSDYNPYIELNSHSGGGNFIFGFMDSCDGIPAYVKKISFLDSDYNWNNDRYGAKLKKWLEATKDNKLFVACYDDANALYEGKSFVSKKGSTWYRTSVMRKFLKKNLMSSWAVEYMMPTVRIPCYCRRACNFLRGSLRPRVAPAFRRKSPGYLPPNGIH